jgi:mRNA-degrading endonuclease YafQ of YafQ-DinJ toxin-antitoxin module
MNYTDALQDKLLFALDGKYRELRDDAHVQPDVVLVYDEATDTVEALELVQLPLYWTRSKVESLRPG